MLFELLNGEKKPFHFEIILYETIENADEIARNLIISKQLFAFLDATKVWFLFPHRFNTIKFFYSIRSSA
jgi:hypothetical protein